MHLLGGDAELGAESEHTAISETGGGVDHDHGRVDALGEFLDGRIVLGNDGFGVTGGMSVDMVDSRF